MKRGATLRVPEMRASRLWVKPLEAPCFALSLSITLGILTLGVNNLLSLYWDMIIYSYEKGSLTPCSGNEGVPAMSKTLWGSLFGPVFINNYGYRQQILLISRTWACVPVVSKFLCLCPEFHCILRQKREPHWLILLTARTPSFAGHEVRLPVSW